MNQITLRAYFAAHAPAEPEKWFSPTFPEPQPKRPDGAEWCEGCKSDSDCDGNADCHVLRKHRQELAAWRKRRDRAASVQWRWAWADAMIEAGLPDGTLDKAVKLLAAIVSKSHLKGGWRETETLRCVAINPTEDVTVHPDLIEDARQFVEYIQELRGEA